MDSIVWNNKDIYDEGQDSGSDDADEGIVDTSEGNSIDAESQDGGGCLIATAAFGSELAPQVQYLREVRDDVLLQTDSGSSFMAGFNMFYYSFSPAVADLERESPEIRGFINTAITPGLYILGIMSAADSNSEASVITLGIITMLSMAGLYVATPALAVWLFRSKFNKTPA